MVIVYRLSGNSFSGQLDADILRLREEVQRLESTFAADAALLHPAERNAQVAQEPAVDPDRPGVQLRGHAVGALQVARPDRGGQAVLRGVGGAHRLLIAVERRDGDDGAEDLLLQDAAFAAEAGDDRRLEKE